LLDEHDHFISRHKRQRKRNFKVLKKNFEDLLDQHCKLLLVRVDVSYLYDANKDIHQFDTDLNTFRRLIHLRQDCFEHVLDYSWAIEQDGTKAITVIFFLSITVQNTCVMDTMLNR
jgi:endo-alpha-1,4-polygalactosaminidase (GH114 family)